MEANSNKNQKVNFKKSAKKFFKNVWQILKNVGEPVLIGIVCVLLFFVAVLVFIVKMLAYFFVYNPIVFWVWAMISPERAACSLNRGTEKVPEDDFGWFTLIVFAPENFYWNLNKACRWALPWRAKREILAVRELREADFCQQLKFFNTGDREAIIKANWLTNNVKNHILTYCEQPIARMLVATMDNLSDAQFRHLVACKNYDAVVTYVNKHTTLSENKLVAWVDALLTELDDNGLDLLCQYARIKSLPAYVVNYLHNKKADCLLAKINPALDIYAQKKMITSTKEEVALWQKYCIALKIKGGVIFDETQHLMDASQYKEFRERGWVLCEKAIVFWFSKDDLSMAEEIIKAENVKVFDTPNIRSLVAANPKLARTLLKKN